MSKFRNACFTSYLDYDAMKFKLTCNGSESNKVKYVVIGRETCPTTGRLHVQGFIQLTHPVTMVAIKKLIGDGAAHIEKMRGNSTEASNYCKKDGHYFEMGTVTSQGERVDLVSIRDQVLRNGTIPIDLIENFQQLRFAEGLMKYYKPPPRDGPPQVWWIYGPTGSGKSRMCFEMHPDAWVSSNKLDWFDGYTGQESVIIDDFRGDMATLHWLLRLTDRYPLRVPVKGGFVSWCPKVIMITSSKSPRDCYPNSDENMNQLLRRITNTVYTGPMPTHIDNL